MSKKRNMRDDRVVNKDGTLGDLSPERVGATVDAIVDHGTPVAMIAINEQGQIGVRAYGPPTQRLVDILKTAAEDMQIVIDNINDITNIRKAN